MKQIILTFLSIAVLGSPAAAEGLKAKQVPANAQWIAHVDIDGFKTSKLGKFTLGRLKDVAAPIDAVAAMLQFDPRKDLSDITAYGNHSKADQPENAAVLLNGRFKPDHLMTLLKAGEGLKVEKAGKHQLLEWTKDKETEYGSIVNEKLLVLGTNRKMVAQALKTVVDSNGGDARPGDELVWTISLANQGDAVAKNTVITDPIDPRLVDVVPSDGGVFAAAAITWQLGDDLNDLLRMIGIVGIKDFLESLHSQQARLGLFEVEHDDLTTSLAHRLNHRFRRQTTSPEVVGGDMGDHIHTLCKTGDVCSEDGNTSSVRLCNRWPDRS